MKQIVFIHFLITVLTFSSIFSQEFGFRVDNGTIESSEIREASGIVASRKNIGVFWTHNDSGDKGRIFAFDSLGKHLGYYNLAGIQNRDWEDIAVGPGPIEGEQYIYIGDIGDNSLRYNSKYIYRILEPNVSVEQTPVDTTLYEVERLVFQYPDGNRNAETLMIDPISRNIYVVSKEANTKVYRLAWPHTFYSAPTLNVDTMEVIASLSFGDAAVGGDISSTGEEILIKSSRVIYYWKRDNGETIEETLMDDIQTVPYFKEPQGEAVTWAGDSSGYYTISEGLYPHLYFYPRLLPTDVASKVGIIENFNLEQNYPNPFNPSTVLRYEIGETRFVTLKVYNILGKEVATLVSKEQSAGSYKVEFNASALRQSSVRSSAIANELSSGVYFYKLQSGSFSETKKMLLLR